MYDKEKATAQRFKTTEELMRAQRRRTALEVAVAIVVAASLVAAVGLLVRSGSGL